MIKKDPPDRILWIHACQSRGSKGLFVRIHVIPYFLRPHSKNHMFFKCEHGRSKVRSTQFISASYSRPTSSMVRYYLTFNMHVYALLRKLFSPYKTYVDLQG